MQMSCRAGGTSALITFLILVCISPVWADKQVVETVTVREAPDASAGQSAEVITWIGNQRYSRFDKLNNITTIVRKDLDKMYIVHHASKEVTEIDLPFTLPDYLQPLFNEVKISWEINRLPDTRKIGRWNCTKVILKGRGMLSIDLEIWVTPETGIDTRAFQAMVGESLQASAIYKEMGEMLYGLSPNFGIRTTTTVEQLGMRAVTIAEVQRIVEEAAPAGTYEPPADYVIRPLDFSTYLSLVRERQPTP